jgi:hypothetical protein
MLREDLLDPRFAYPFGQTLHVTSCHECQKYETCILYVGFPCFQSQLALKKSVKSCLCMVDLGRVFGKIHICRKSARETGRTHSLTWESTMSLCPRLSSFIIVPPYAASDDT